MKLLPYPIDYKPASSHGDVTNFAQRQKDRLERMRLEQMKKADWSVVQLKSKGWKA